MKSLYDGDWVHMLLTKDGKIVFEPSSEKAAMDNYKSKRNEPVKLPADLNATSIFKTEELSWKDNDKVGSKAANYAELAKALNTNERTVVRPGYAIPFFYYQQFIDGNPDINAAIAKVLKDPLMDKIAKVEYREQKLKVIRDMIMAETSIVDEKFLNNLITTFDQVKTSDGLPHKMKLRSSTNSEDLPNFNGAGLYDSASYKPAKDGKEKSVEKKMKNLKETLKLVWASVWGLRAYDERAYFQIPHADVKMAMQVNPSFGNELVDGVVVTKNIANDSRYPGAAVYIESQRGDKYNATKPEAGTRPTKTLVLYDEAQPLNTELYKVVTLQKSNVADDDTTVLPDENPNDMMTEAEAKDLAALVLKAEAHFKPLLGKDKADFALDLEFKVDAQDSGQRQVYLKQARPYID
jgi:phosphoenolpyruvate synthase/pyruvate phosphate dikinase